MYAIISDYKTLQALFSVQNILDLLLFLLLVFLGVTARITIDIEISKKKLKDIGIFNRYFLAVVLSYVLELYTAQNTFLKKHYAEMIILFCIFVNDIIKIVLDNRIKLFFYLLNGLLKVTGDLKNLVNKDNNDTGNNTE